MNLTIFLIILLLGVLAILYGHKYNHGEMIMVGFATTFVIGLALSGATGVVGLTSGIEFVDGATESYSYLVNSSDIDTITVSNTYTTYTNAFFGAWMAVMSFFGFFGVLTGRKIFG